MAGVPACSTLTRSLHESPVTRCHTAHLTFIHPSHTKTQVTSAASSMADELEQLEGALAAKEAEV